jgi:hypothetical protein
LTGSSHQEVPGARIVTLTEWCQGEDRPHTVDAGFDDNLTKPADAAQIQRILDGGACAQRIRMRTGLPSTR